MKNSNDVTVHLRSTNNQMAHIVSIIEAGQQEQDILGIQFFDDAKINTVSFIQELTLVLMHRVAQQFHECRRYEANTGKISPIDRKQVERIANQIIADMKRGGDGF